MFFLVGIVSFMSVLWLARIQKIQFGPEGNMKQLNIKLVSAILLTAILLAAISDNGVCCFT